MIGSKLPPISNPIPNHRVYGFEAFAFTYLAKYFGVDIAGRCRDSYRNAFGTDLIKTFPSMGAGKPGFVMALWVERRPMKVMIAIPGTPGMADVLAFINNTGPAAVTGVEGRVHLLMRDHADAILGVLQADEDWQFATNHRAHELTLAGFSLGAGTAEILAAYLHAQDANRPLRVYKFASPRVGNLTWQRATLGRYPFQSWFTFDDPIPHFPRDGFHLNPLTTIWEGRPYIWYERDWSPQIFSEDGRRTGGWNDSHQNSRDWSSLYYFLVNGASEPPWQHHLPRYYRWLFYQWLHHNESMLDRRRHAHLEHPDENNWQDIIGGAGNYNLMVDELLGTPTTYEPTPAELGRHANPEILLAPVAAPEQPRQLTLRVPVIESVQIQRSAWGVKGPPRHRHARRLNP